MGPRIRSIKPEFPQSESMGRVSRDARLAFILMWTRSDDAGRLRGNSRMLASYLFPYDDDAPSLIDAWIAELVREQCIDLYAVGGATYVQVRNWLKHQRIDKPSESKLPPFDESARILASVREPSCQDQDQDQGRDRDQGKDRRITDPRDPPQGGGGGSPADRPERATDIAAADGPSLTARLAIEARRHGIECHPLDPRLIAMAEQGVGPELMAAACERARKAKPNEAIGIGYVVKIVEGWAKQARDVATEGAALPAQHVGRGDLVQIGGTTLTKQGAQTAQALQRWMQPPATEATDA